MKTQKFQENIPRKFYPFTGNVMRHILGKYIWFVLVCDHLDWGYERKMG